MEGTSGRNRWWLLQVMEWNTRKTTLWNQREFIVRKQWIFLAFVFLCHVDLLKYSYHTNFGNLRILARNACCVCDGVKKTKKHAEFVLTMSESSATFVTFISIIKGDGVDIH